MPIPLSVQLYSLREEMKDGKHLPYIKRLAELGYKGVECAGTYGLTHKAYRTLIQDHGMIVSGTHAMPPEPGQEQKLIDEVRDLGLDTVVCPWSPPEEWKTVDSITKTAERFEKARAALAKGGVSFAYHNHDHELVRIQGKTGLEHFLTAAPQMKLEIDTYWASNFGAEDAAKIVAQFKDRTPLLHIKDGPLVKGQQHLAVGSGKMHFPSVIAAADPKVTKWLVVELDSCATDMWKAVEDSYHYLVGHGLASGNKPARAASKR